MTTPSIGRRVAAEAVGTFWLVFAGLGSAIFAAGVPGVGIGYLGVSIAVGLTVLTMAYAVGHISGCHLNPAVSIGLCIGRRFPERDLLPYILAQVLGGTAGAAMLYVIASGAPGFVGVGDFASNGYGQHSPGHYSLAAGFVTEMTLTFMFLWIIMGSTDRRAPQGFAPISIGLGLTLIHLIGIPITNLSVNPARSTATALFTGGWALTQLWMFWLAPIVGAALGGLVYKYLGGEGRESAISPLEKLTEQSEARARSAEKADRAS